METASKPAPIADSVAQSKRPKKSFWQGSGALIGIGSLILANFIGRTLGIIGVVLFYGPILLGLWFSSWYMRRPMRSARLLKALAWSNVATWILPPLGLLTSTMTFGVAKAPEASARKFRVLAATSLVLSLVNGLVGALSASQ